MQEAELKFTHVSGYVLEEFDFASYEYESIGVDIDVGPKGVDGSNIFFAFFVTPNFMADPARAHDSTPAEWTDERKIIVSAIALKPIQDALNAILEPSLALGWPECIDRLRINLLWEYEGMEPVEPHR
ncbi:immunity 8 family protein [Bosea sp. LjRoot90]|uniref:Imm8 family immunity protein n=1 Tax=Bosea sp. LjRoot90 TaxID=3342342 RepID=UPI003ED12BC4